MAKNRAKTSDATRKTPGGINHVLFASKGFEPISRQVVNADGANDVEGGLRCLATQTELWGAEAVGVLKRKAGRNDG